MNHLGGRRNTETKSWQDSMPKFLMVVAVLLATMSFQVSVSPPGGVWSDDLKDGQNRTIRAAGSFKMAISVLNPDAKSDTAYRTVANAVLGWAIAVTALLAIKYLSAAGFGAKLLAVFGNGMVRSFISARTLTPEDMIKPKLAAEIPKQLHKFHQVEIPASDLKFDDNEKQRKYETVSFKEIHDELLELKELTGLLNAPVVFAHSDLLSGNLMLNDEEGTQVKMNSIISLALSDARQTAGGA
ncbi:hypothetical protein NL676_032964 [Syzygium grande]|nr:hypothetical protein NL676_032964 [Syzygium grande]